MNKKSRVEDYQTHHLNVPEGREFVLEVQFQSGRPVRIKNRRLMSLVSRLLSWEGRAESATIRSFEAEVVVSPWTTTRVWNAARGRYDYPTESAPYIVRGLATVDTTGVKEYTSRSLRGAIDFAIYWLVDSFDKPDWVYVVGPNGRIVLSRRELLRMYHAEVRARHDELVTERSA